MLQGWWEARFVEPWKSRLTAAENKDHRTDTLNGAVQQQSNTRTRQLIWDNEVRLSPPHAITVGLEGRNQTLDSGSVLRRATRCASAKSAPARIGYLGRLGGHALQANYRYEDYSDFGAEGTYYLGYGYDLTAAWRVTVSQGTAFRAPTFLDLDPAFGNPNLQPERSKTNEIGVQWASGPHRLRVTLLRHRVPGRHRARQPVHPAERADARRTRGSRPATTACLRASTCARRSPSRTRWSRTAPTRRRSRRCAARKPWPRCPRSATSAPCGWACDWRASGERRDRRHHQFDRHGVRAGLLRCST